MISNVKKNGGFISFSGKFTGMRKEQEFTLCSQEGGRLLVQSSTRIGYLDKRAKTVNLCKPIQSGAYFVHLGEATISSSITEKEIAMLLSSD